MVSVGGGSLLLFVLFQFIVFPLVDKRANLIKRIESHEKQLVEMRGWATQLRSLTEQSGSFAEVLKKREPGFSLFSFLEKNAAESKVKDHIAYMKPSESQDSSPVKQTIVEMKLQGIGLKQLVDFLERTESPANLVAIDKMSVQENSNEDRTLDVTLKLVSIDQMVAAGR